MKAKFTFSSSWAISSPGHSCESVHSPFCGFHVGGQLLTRMRVAWVPTLTPLSVNTDRGEKPPHHPHPCAQLQEETQNLSFHPTGPGEQLLLAEGCEMNPRPSELKVLLIGRRGAGKSTVGNSLVGRPVFETKFSNNPVTTKFKSESRMWRKRKIMIIDGPDLSYSEDLISDLRKKTPKGPHAFLLVTPLGSFAERDKKLLDTIQSSFADEVTKYMAILLTRKEDLGGEEVETFLKSNADLRELIQKCGGRSSVFNYRATGEEEQRQVDELLQRLVDLAEQNRDQPCRFGKEGKPCRKQFLCSFKQRTWALQAKSERRHQDTHHISPVTPPVGKLTAHLFTAHRTVPAGTVTRTTRCLWMPVRGQLS